MRVLRLRLKNWKNFQDIDVPLEDRVFIIGPNAAGKSNLLDALRFLQEVAIDGLRPAIERRDGVSKIRNLNARRDPEISIAVTLGDTPEDPEWLYELVIVQDNQRQAQVRREIVRHRDRSILDRPVRDDHRDRLRLSQTHLEQVTANREFRAVSEFLASIRYLHLVPQIIRDPRRGRSGADDPFGSDFLERVAATTEKTRTARLKRINEALRVAVPQLRDLHFVRDPQDGTPHLEGTFAHWRPNAGRQREAQFSDGTLRLLGLLWALLEGTGPLVLEEPELSLHAAIVRELPQLFRRTSRVSHRQPRQILVSTHSFDLLSDEGIQPSEVLVLSPDSEATAVRVAANIPEIRDLVEGGVSMAEAAMPFTAPRNAFQLSLFSK